MTESRTPPEYSFEEFCKQLDDIHGRDYFQAANRPDAQHPPCWERSIIEVSEYMKSLCPDWQEGSFKLSRFMLIMDYIAEHIHDFDKCDFAVYGSEKVGALVGEHLFHAVHQIFTTGDLSALGTGPTPGEVMELARTLRQ